MLLVFWSRLTAVTCSHEPTSSCEGRAKVSFIPKRTDYSDCFYFGKLYKHVSVRAKKKHSMFSDSAKTRMALVRQKQFKSSY